MGDNSVEESSKQVRALLRRLHPDAGNHKDRIRRMNKFRLYVSGDRNNTPEFFDDDIPLLLLGSHSDAAGDEDDDDGVVSDIYGLMEACGSPSVEHERALKRSARNAMGLLRHLVCEFREVVDGRETVSDVQPLSSLWVSSNPFALAFCSLHKDHYKLLRLDRHLNNDNVRGNAREDACTLIVVLLTNHLSEDGESPAPLMVEDLLRDAVHVFDLWVGQNTPKEIQDKIKKNTIARKNEIALEAREAQLANKQLGRISEEFDFGDDEDRTNADDGDTTTNNDMEDQDSEDDFDDGDVLAGFNRRKKQRKKDLKAMAKAGELKHQGPATRWEDSQLYREQKAKAASATKAAAAGEVHQTVRDTQEAMQALHEREEEKAKILGKDPLGIRDTTFDLRVVQQRQAEIMEQALQELDEGIHDNANSGGGDKGAMSALNLLMSDPNNPAFGKESSEGDEFKKRQAQKESLMAIVDRLGGMEQLETQQSSVLFTEPNFDPMLFLSLVHLDVGYKQLTGSIDRLTNKIENQVQQVQNLVRENFPLFVRCAEGIDAFHEKTAAEVGPGVNERVDGLEALAESCAEKAKKSFKPLLDNASEVRKVQSAIAVLQRVAPILQVPFLMRQHIENRRYSQALKAYRRVLVIDENNTIELLNHVKYQAGKYLYETRNDLERSLAQGADKASVQDLLDGIRDLSELLELDVPIDLLTYEFKRKRRRKKRPKAIENENKDDGKNDDKNKGANDKKEADSDSESEESDSSSDSSVGRRGIDPTSAANFRQYPPALACLMTQATHFNSAVYKAINDADQACNKLLQGEKLSQIEGDLSARNQASAMAAYAEDRNGNSNDKKGPSAFRISDAGTQWKYDVLDARVMATQKAVDTVRNWLPRLLRIGKAAREDEKRRAARVYRRPHTANLNTSSHHNINFVNRKGRTYMNGSATAFEVFVSKVIPKIKHLVEHAAFCGLGCPSRGGGKELSMTFGEDAPEKLRSLLRAPLPPSQSTRVDAELAELVDLLAASSEDINALRQEEDNASYQDQASPLDECKTFAESAVVTIEKRRCIYAFEVCARVCSIRASGSGKFDADELLTCLKTLSEKLTRPEECTTEVEKGCELVVRRCCEGLASYVRDRGDSARLSAVAECAEVMENIIGEIVREASFLTTNAEKIEEVMMDDIMGLEGAMFDEYLESIKENVANSVKVGWLDYENNETALAALQGHSADRPDSSMAAFPPYLSTSLLSIVRCRAQVEQALGERVRKSDENKSYQHLSMTTVADGVVEGICHAVESRKMRLKVRQADRLANELQFLLNTLQKFLTTETAGLLESIRHTLCARAGRGGGDGPEGLAALEDLERLGRVYVLCLGE